jgi:uncharacterized OB-fold protein
MPLDLEVVATSRDRPLPTPNPFSRPFWEATKRHQLVLQKCDKCGTVRYYPRPRCPECLSAEATWTEMSGHGTVYSFTIVHRPLARWFAAKVPLVCAVIELDEGVRMMSDVENIDPEDVRIGLPVRVIFDDVDEEITLPKFEPAA